MIIHVLFTQQKENYPGEHAPEAVACVDEYTLEISPDAKKDEEESRKLSNDKSIYSFAWVALNVPREEIRQRLIPQEVAINVKVVKP